MDQNTAMTIAAVILACGIVWALRFCMKGTHESRSADLV